MKKAILAGLMLASVSLSAEAITLHRWPLDYYANPAYSRWYDHNHTTRYTRRYDGATNRLNEDEHHGTDILGNISPTYIRAGAGGTLYYAILNCPNPGYLGSSCGSGYGNHVRILHNDGSGRVTIYAHMLPNWPGSSGWKTCGQQIGIMGSSGSSTATHLHMEIWRNQYVSISSPHTDRLDLFGGPGNTSGTGTFWVNQNGTTTAPVYPSMSCQ